MYNIYYNLEDYGSPGHTIESSATTVVKAFMDAIREIRRVLTTTKVELLPVSETEFVIWAYDFPQGYLSIKQVGPETSATDLEKR